MSFKDSIKQLSGRVLKLKGSIYNNKLYLLFQLKMV